MTDVLERLRICVERGKADRDSPHPPDLAEPQSFARHLAGAAR